MARSVPRAFWESKFDLDIPRVDEMRVEYTWSGYRGSRNFEAGLTRRDDVFESGDGKAIPACLVDDLLATLSGLYASGCFKEGPSISDSWPNFTLQFFAVGESVLTLSSNSGARA